MCTFFIFSSHTLNYAIVQLLLKYVWNILRPVFSLSCTYVIIINVAVNDSVSKLQIQQ